MKITHAAAKVAVFAAVFLGLLAGSSSAAEDPIPGVDVVVRKKPGGKAMPTTSDSGGKFVFNNLSAGKYELSVTMPQTRALINTSRSNIRHPNLRVVDGAEVADVAITLGTGQPEPVEIEITKDGGKITGTVARAEAATNSEAKPEQGTPKKAAELKPIMDGISTTRKK